MKKILLLLAVAFCSVAAKAQDVLYVEDVKAQAGSTVTAKMMLKNPTNIVGAFVGTIAIEGVDLNTVSIEAVDPSVWTLVPAMKSGYIAFADGCIKGAASYYPASEEAFQVATVTFKAPEEPGDYVIRIDKANLTWGDMSNSDLPAVETTLTVQRAEFLQNLPEGYGFAVAPFVAQASQNNVVTIYVKTPEILTGVEFDINLPQGMALYNDQFEETLPEIVPGATNTNGATVTKNASTAIDEFSAHVKLTGNKLKGVGVLASSEYTPLLTLTSYCFNEGEMGEPYDAVLNTIDLIKIDNIKITDVKGNVYTGNTQASVFFGTPTDKDPIVYGYLNEDGLNAVKSSLAGARTLDITRTFGNTVEAAATALEGTYVQGATQSALMPKSQGTYRTVCVPFAVSGTGRYVIREVDASSITLSPAPDTIPANTPFVATAGVVVGDESVYPNPDITHETSAGALLFKGIYKKTTINTGTYYIAQDKFWKAESEVTVAPFKAILVGSLAAKSLKIFIEDETGIREVTNQFDNEDIYNLQGIKLNKTQKGINIVGGKKVILK